MKTLADVALFCEVDTLFPDTNRDAAETDPNATNISYSTGVANAPVAADHVSVKDPSLFGVTSNTTWTKTLKNTSYAGGSGECIEQNEDPTNIPAPTSALTISNCQVQTNNTALTPIGNYKGLVQVSSNIVKKKGDTATTLLDQTSFNVVP